jgi:predicted nucleotidyltransferase
MSTDTKITPELKIQDVITLTARLAQLLAEEVDLLGEMKVQKIEALQKEKLFM